MRSGVDHWSRHTSEDTGPRVKDLGRAQELSSRIVATRQEHRSIRQRSRRVR